MDWHRYSGYLVVALILFRLYWGVVGGTNARFSSFVRGPRSILVYLRRRGADRVPSVGHNPLGGWSVLALLLVLLTQVGSGLLAVDTDGIESGPFSYLVSFDHGRLAAQIHEVSFKALQILVIVHIAAVSYYLICHRENLVAAMISGYKRLPERHVRAVALGRKSLLWIGVIGAAGVAYYLFTRPTF